MRREMKVSVSVALSLILGFFMLSSSSVVDTAHAVNKAPSQSATQFKSDDVVIARITVTDEQEMQRLLAVGVQLLDRRTGDDFYVLTTFEKSESLRSQGFPVTILYLRGHDYHQSWKAVEIYGGECTYTINETQKILTGDGGFAEFKLTTGTLCEWTFFSDSPWLRANGVGQGTGSAALSLTIERNNTPVNRIGHAFVAGNIFTVFQGATFADVPLSHPFYVAISRLSALGITVGCGGENYCPDDPVARDQVAAFIIRSLGEFDPPTPAMQRFTDVPPSNIFYNFVDRMAVLGITQGCTATTYCPADGLRRDQAATFIIRALGELDPPNPPAQRFADVPPDSPYYRFVDRLAALQITQGCSTNPLLFCPEAPVSRGQIAVFLIKAFNL
jgi:hypothetical protein